MRAPGKCGEFGPVEKRDRAYEKSVRDGVRHTFDWLSKQNPVEAIDNSWFEFRALLRLLDEARAREK